MGHGSTDIMPDNAVGADVKSQMFLVVRKKINQSRYSRSPDFHKYIPGPLSFSSKLTLQMSQQHPYLNIIVHVANPGISSYHFQEVKTIVVGPNGHKAQ